MSPIVIRQSRKAFLITNASGTDCSSLKYPLQYVLSGLKGSRNVKLSIHRLMFGLEGKMAHAVQNSDLYPRGVSFESPPGAILRSFPQSLQANADMQFLIRPRTDSFQTLFNPLIACRPVIRRYTFRVTDGSVR
jgi:hypothetical protein